MHLWGRLLAVTDAATNAETSRTLEILVIHTRFYLKLFVQLLQAKDPLTVSATNSSLPLAALRLPTEMACPRQSRFFRFVEGFIMRSMRWIQTLWNGWIFTLHIIPHSMNNNTMEIL